LHHKVQKFSSGTGSPGWCRKKGRKTVVVWCGKTINGTKNSNPGAIIATPKRQLLAQKHAIQHMDP